MIFSTILESNIGSSNSSAFYRIAFHDNIFSHYGTSTLEKGILIKTKT